MSQGPGHTGLDSSVRQSLNWVAAFTLLVALAVQNPARLCSLAALQGWVFVEAASCRESGEFLSRRLRARGSLSPSHGLGCIGSGIYTVQAAGLADTK